MLHWISTPAVHAIYSFVVLKVALKSCITICMYVCSWGAVHMLWVLWILTPYEHGVGRGSTTLQEGIVLPVHLFIYNTTPSIWAGHQLSNTLITAIHSLGKESLLAQQKSHCAICDIHMYQTSTGTQGIWAVYIVYSYVYTWLPRACVNCLYSYCILLLPSALAQGNKFCITSRK